MHITGRVGRQTPLATFGKLGQVDLIVGYLSGNHPRHPHRPTSRNLAHSIGRPRLVGGRRPHGRVVPRDGGARMQTVTEEGALQELTIGPKGL